MPAESRPHPQRAEHSDRPEGRLERTGDPAVLSRHGWIRSTVEGMWENPLRVEGPVSLPEALELETGRVASGRPDEHGDSRREE